MANGFMAGLSGNPDARRLTLRSLGDNIGPAAASCGLNAAGGAAARFLSNKIEASRPGFATLGIALVALALKTALQPIDAVNQVIREMASGMAGWVGDDIMDGFMLWLRSTAWKPATVYTKGAFVRHAGEYWQAAEDVPKDGTEPGKDARWHKVAATTYGLTDIKECARLVLLDATRVDMISKFIATELGKGRGWDSQVVAGSAADITKALNQVGEEIAKL